MISAISTYSNKDKASFYIFNFLRQDNPLYEQLNAIGGFDADINMSDKASEITERLKAVYEDIERRKEKYDNEMKDIYIFIYGMELGQVFKPVKSSYGYGFDSSEAMQLLSDILREGPLMRVHTILQIDNYHNLSQMSDDILWYFNHRIALQMNSSDSNRIIDDDAASSLYIEGSEWTKYRGYYFNQSKNILTKFRPYNSQISK